MAMMSQAIVDGMLKSVAASKCPQTPYKHRHLRYQQDARPLSV